MANEERWGVTWLQVVLDGSGDWTSSRKVRLKSLKFMPSAPGDSLVIREVTPGLAWSSWPQIKLSSSSGDPVGCLFDSSIPTLTNIPYSLCNFANVSSAVITFEFY